MSFTRHEIPITFSGARTKVVGEGASAASDAYTPDESCVAISVTCKADNETTPEAGDIVTVTILASAGDPDGSSTHEYPTTGATGTSLDTEGDADPAIGSFELSIGYQSYKFHFANGGSNNDCTVSAVVTEIRHYR